MFINSVDLKFSNRMSKKVDFDIFIRFLWRLTVIYVCFFYSLNGKAQIKKTMIACIGNSITAGARLTNPEVASYPAVLTSLLKENGYSNYEIKNFGVGGATVLRFGKPNLWRVLDSLKNFPPDIVIIKAGTNETVGQPRFNWEHINEFEKDYSDYVAAIRKINPTCRIIICSPLDMVIQTDGLSSERKEDLSLRRPRIWELRKKIKKIAKNEHLFFLDLTKPFKGKTNLMTISDGVHPNKDGYEYLAKQVFNFMVKREIVVQ